MKKTKAKVNAAIIIIGNEILKSANCLNRVSASNIYCKVDNPLGNNSAFDGYAINSMDTKNLSKKKNRLFKRIRGNSLN